MMLILIGLKKIYLNVVLQGGLDPKILLSKTMKKFLNNAKKYLDIFKGLPYIFNLRSWFAS